VRGATWQEIDWANAVWVIQREDEGRGDASSALDATGITPASFRPLSRGRAAQPHFRRPEKEGLKRCLLGKGAEADGGSGNPHGFRSSFRDWVGEQTDYKSELPEKALAHTVKNATEAAYQRADMLELRRPMMLDWANYADGAYRQNKAVEQTLDA
jgi:integrase